MKISDFLVVDSEERKANLNKYFSELYSMLGGYKKEYGDFNDYPYEILSKRDDVISKAVNIPIIKLLKKNASDKPISRIGYMNYNDEIYKTIAAQISSKLNSQLDQHTMLNSQSFLSRDFLKQVLNDSFAFTGYPSIIWHSHIDIKEPSSIALSDQWHYDNHYHPLMHKMILYCSNNCLSEGGGKTDIICSSMSYAYTMRTSYIGTTPQRCLFNKIEKRLGEKLYSYLPEDKFDFKSGNCIFFSPSQCLHRSISPKQGKRITLTMSFMPFPLHTYDLELLCQISNEVIGDPHNEIECDAPVFFKRLIE